MESRYTKEYEEQLNPFTAFQDKERSARRRQLSPTDRLLYEVGQMVTGSRYVVCSPLRDSYHLFSWQVFCYAELLFYSREVQAPQARTTPARHIMYACFGAAL